MQKTLKALIVGIIGLLAVGCASTPTMKNVAGTYELKKNGKTIRLAFLDNGVVAGFSESSVSGKKAKGAKWKIINKEIHFYQHGDVTVLKINKDGSLTTIAEIDKDALRTDRPKEEQFTLKKIK